MIWSLIMLVFSLGKTFGQVSNNNISSRSQLVLEHESTVSTTNNSTVEWQCVNKKLTNKCLVYHNDQWFTFTPPQEGKYYINVSTSNCKDNKGIQAIVIQGNPCETATYKILKCVPQIMFQDSFIEIDSMQPNVNYLVNIDGFLGDYCEFSIRFSSNPNGVAVDARPLKRLDLKGSANQEVHKLTWRLPFTLQDSIVSFSIFRKQNYRQVSQLRGSVALEYNAKGESQSEYHCIDSMSVSRPYSYQVVGNMKDNSQVVLDEWFVKDNISNSLEFKISFTLDYPNNSKLQMLLIDGIRDVVLRQRSFTFNEILDKTTSFYVEDDVRKGISVFKVIVVEMKTRRKREMLFNVDRLGKVSVHAPND